ncbi:hypothetical protein PWT90_08121 [Aphanocladium album]|nr:hypothetical protein PWT90_08121 [Aphanocladium album]
MDALTGSIAHQADTCAADIQAALVCHTDFPHLTSACSALESLRSSVVQLRGSVRDGSNTSSALTTVMTESLQAGAAQAALLFKQVSRLDADNARDTNERFWTVLSVFVGAHVKLFSCYTDILSLPTENDQNERLNSMASQEVIQQAAHAVRLAADAPDIFTSELSHAPLAYRAREADAEETPPPYRAGASLPSQSAATVTVRSASPQESHTLASASASGGGSTARSRAWAKLTSPIKAIRGHMGSGGSGAALPFVEELCAAASDGQAKHVEALLAQGAPVDGVSSGYDTALVHAAAINDVSMATILLAFGADPNARDVTGRPILVQAIENQNGALIRFLLDSGADANCKDMTGASALSLACERHAPTSDVVPLLLRRGARVDSTTVVGVTVLADALVRHRVDLARLLLEHGADPRGATEVTGQPALITVVQSKKIVLEDKLDLLQRMLERGAVVDVQDFVTGETAVEVARRVECSKVVKLLESYRNGSAS